MVKRKSPKHNAQMPEVVDVCLVGSSPTAKSITEACGRVGKKAILLGGAKNYLVALEGAQMDLLINNIVQSGYGTAGQRCLASLIIAVMPGLYDEVIKRLRRCRHERRRVHGAVISAQAKQRIENYIQSDAGARLVFDGRNPGLSEANKNGYFVGPPMLYPAWKLFRKKFSDLYYR